MHWPIAANVRVYGAIHGIGTPGEPGRHTPARRAHCRNIAQWQVTVAVYPAGYLVRLAQVTYHYCLCSKRDVFNLGAPHRRVDQAYPTITDSRLPEFLCTAHALNDSGTDSLRHSQLEKSQILDLDTLKDRLGPEFAHVDLAALARLAQAQPG